MLNVLYKTHCIEYVYSLPIHASERGEDDESLLCITNSCDASCYRTRHLSFVSERVTPPNHGRALQSWVDLRLPVDGNLDDAGGGSGGLLRPIPPTAS